jgi:hypothetical protein
VGSATGIGSLPGTDIAEAQRIVLGELPDLPHLPELPNRGTGADMIGRGARFLLEMPVQVYAGTWSITSRPGKDMRRAADLLDRDLDQISEQAEGFAGTFKIQAVGPWTLAASLDLAIGGRLLRDPGAVRDLIDSLAEGLRLHVANVQRRIPKATVLLQLDEPMLPTVMRGHVPTESGFGAYRAVEATNAATGLRTIVEKVGTPVVVHCCAPEVPLQVVRDAGAVAVALDLAFVKDLDPLGEAIEAGLGLFAGAVDTRAPSVPRAIDSGQVAERVRTLWNRLSFPARRLPQQVVVTPACGLAGADDPYVRTVLAACRDAGRRLYESE